MQAISIQDDVWLSEVCQFRASKLDIQSELSSQECIELRFWLERNMDFAFTKLAIDSTVHNNLVRLTGCNLIETNVQMRWELANSPVVISSSEVHIREAVPDDEDQVAEIASTSFDQSRFFQDPQFGKEKARRIKELWVRNFFSGTRGEIMLLAESRGKIVGFLQGLRRSPSEWIIDLIAVDASSRRAGVGCALIDTLKRHSGAIALIDVGTQLKNNQSLRFYESLGFKFISASYVLHWHKEKVS
jgi:ribosomal protein S18 acetylase RimI-like enzyme